MAGERRVAGDEPGVPAHHLDQPDAVGRRACLGQRGLDRLGGPGERGLEPEALVEVRDVVVDRLRHPDDGQLQPRAAPPSTAIFAAPRSEPSPPITNRTEIPSLTSVSTISDGSWSPREVPRMVPPRLWMSATTSRDRRTGATSGAGQAAEAVAEPDHVGDAVVVGQLEDQAADHVVQPGAQAAARHDPGPGPGRVEVDVLARAARLQARAGPRRRTAAPRPRRACRRAARGPTRARSAVSSPAPARAWPSATGSPARRGAGRAGRQA